MSLNPQLHTPEKPLVTVVIYNYNYGQYLRECFESVLAQTYENTEICFSDNASTDDSWDIALEYQKKYPDVFFVARNRKNFGSDANLRNCSVNIRGKYFVYLCSDDALLPDFIRKCVEGLEEHPDTAFAMAHRAILDENGQYLEEPSFYNQTCKIPGPSQAAVYMMAAVNPAISQIMYRGSLVYNKGVIGGLAARWYGTRLMDFNICCEHPIIYIHEPLMLHRLHLSNDSTKATENLLEAVCPYILNHQYAEMASGYGHTKVVERLPAATHKISQLSLRYCLRSLRSGNPVTAKRYWHLAAAFDPSISDDTNYRLLNEYWNATEDQQCRILDQLNADKALLVRTHSYAPPPDAIPLTIR